MSVVSTFLDTSALVKIYHAEEIGAQALMRYLTERPAALYLSELSEPEFSSAIYRKYRRSDMTAPIAEGLIDISKFRLSSNYDGRYVRFERTPDSEYLLRYYP